ELRMTNAPIIFHFTCCIVIWLSMHLQEDVFPPCCQEEDLNCVRERWSDALIKRREYLDEQIKKVSNKKEKTEDDMEREARLVEQWVGLTEERNAVLVPAPGSGIPGAPADWIPPPGMETHIPVLFLDLNADDLSANEQLVGPHASGVNSILPKEHGSQFFYLPIIKHSDEEVSATASWDSSVHDSVHLNRVTPQNERIYLIVKTTVQLSHPAAMELVLRKRIAANIYNKQSFTQSLKRRISLKNIFYSCGVTYEIVSNIPKATEEIEDRETLALMAARSENEGTSDGETYIEKYTRGVLQVENILSLERLRQAVTVKEALSTKARQLRRSLSTPNVHNVSSPTRQGLPPKWHISGFGVEPQGWPESQLDMSDYSPSYQDVSCYGTLPRDSPRRSKEGRGCTSENPHALTVSPFKAFSPQPPKFFKPLMPVKEEHKKRMSLEAKPLLSQEDSEEEENDLEALNRKLLSSQPYVPVEFADFSVYNASLESREWFSSKVDLTNSKVLEKDVSRSPTTSSITSGYFSHSASNATLSDMVVPSSDSSDQLALPAKDADASEHPGPSFVHDFRPSSNKELTELDRGLVKDKMTMVPLKENSALAKGSPSSQSTPEKNSTALCRTGSCSGQEACSSRKGPPARGFCPREVTGCFFGLTPQPQPCKGHRSTRLSHTKSCQN
uniref:Kinesin-like domain-containing protein n=1 Tax=Sus scrofa TaxID=9823 RepID=A0A8D0Y3D4_PIG